MLDSEVEKQSKPVRMDPGRSPWLASRVSFKRLLVRSTMNSPSSSCYSEYQSRSMVDPVHNRTRSECRFEPKCILGHPYIQILHMCRFDHKYTLQNLESRPSYRDDQRSFQHYLENTHYRLDSKLRLPALHILPKPRVRNVCAVTGATRLSRSHRKDGSQA